VLAGGVRITGEVGVGPPGLRPLRSVGEEAGRGLHPGLYHEITPEGLQGLMTLPSNPLRVGIGKAPGGALARLPLRQTIAGAPRAARHRRTLAGAPRGARSKPSPLSFPLLRRWEADLAPGEALLAADDVVWTARASTLASRSLTD